MPTRLVQLAFAVNSVPLSTSFSSVMLRNGAAGVVMPLATTCPNALRTSNAHDSMPDSGSMNSWVRTRKLTPEMLAGKLGWSWKAVGYVSCSETMPCSGGVVSSVHTIVRASAVAPAPLCTTSSVK
eukprot:scaffold133332_cov78-Phaeocystis_antarctica.AAC.9